MNYTETLDYLYTQLPMFTRVGSSAFKKDLTNTLALCERLDNPQYKFKSVHVGGTNGKGSTSHMLAAILQTAGYKTGLYTSPHLRDFRERIRINGQMITEQQVIDFVARHQTDFEQIQPSFFEMTVALAFDFFAKEQVDIAVIEVGLGGRLDSTNVITPLLSIITNIGWDHMNLLGNTLSEIAGEKAGIIKPDVPVIIGEYQPEVAPVFEHKAKEVKVPLTFASEQWVVKQSKNENGLVGIAVSHSTGGNNSLSPLNLLLDLTGSYQLKNIKTVLAAVEELRKQGFVITDEHLQTALRQVQHLTGLAGRWQTLSTGPLTICDTGHNPEGIAEVVKNIQSVTYRQLHMVIGMVNDKDLSKVLALLPQQATYYFCKPDLPRGLDAHNLQEQAATFGLKGDAYPSVQAALAAAQQQAGDGDLVFVGGSTFTVAEVV
ncbi:folylpolyglutamate synthase/dihydrofolate synthase family protein [Mucilaginibacter koreensis]